MTSKSLIQKNSNKVTQMSENTLRNLLAEKERFNKKSSQKYDFMGVPVTLSKLTIAQVEDLQELNKSVAKALEEGEQNVASELDIMFSIIRVGCVDFVELEDTEIKNFPMDELVKLSNAISKHSGLDQGKK